MSRLQKIITLSMTEAEYVAMIEPCNELILLKDFMKELGKEQVSPSLHIDSQRAIDLANNPIYLTEPCKLMCGTTSVAYF